MLWPFVGKTTSRVTWETMGAKIIAALIASLVVAGIASGGPGVNDSPRIVLWHLIGSAGLRMSRAEVERVYGRPYYPGPEEPQYKVRGGVLFIGYGRPCNSTGCHGKVEDVSTSAPRYRTRTGLGVGTPIRFPAFVPRSLSSGLGAAAIFLQLTRAVPLAMFQGRFLAIGRRGATL